MSLPILSVITFTPLLGAIVVAILPSRHPDLIRRTTLGFTLAAWVMSLLLLAAYAFGQTGFSSSKRTTGSRPSASSTRSASTA